MFKAEVIVLNIGETIVINLDDIFETCDEDVSFTQTADDYVVVKCNNWSYQVSADDVEMWFTLKTYESQQLKKFQ
jgi:hypothetical protein